MTLTLSSILFVDTEEVHRVTNHPVHIYDHHGKQSPSALIPFCEFGKNMSTMGLEASKLILPVCDSFEAKYLNDQLCYEVDVNKFKYKKFRGHDLKLGFSFLVDTNQARQTQAVEYGHSQLGRDLGTFIQYFCCFHSIDYFGTMIQYLQLQNLPKWKMPQVSHSTSEH